MMYLMLHCRMYLVQDMCVFVELMRSGQLKNQFRLSISHDCVKNGHAVAVRERSSQVASGLPTSYEKSVSAHRHNLLHVGFLVRDIALDY